MMARIRIRPRLWMAANPARAPWRWIPLTLLFRKRRLAARPAPAVAQAHSTSSQTVSYYTRHLHHHTHEGARIASRTHLLETILREQSKAVQPTPKDDARPASATPMPPLHTRERSMEMRLSTRVTHDLEQLHTRIHRIETIARESDVTRLERIDAFAIDKILMPAQQRFLVHRTEPGNMGQAFPARRRSIHRTIDIQPEPSPSKITRPSLTRRWAAEPDRTADVHASLAAPMPVQQVWRTQQPGRESAREAASAFSPASGAASASHSQFAAQPQASNQATPLPAPRKLDGPEMDRLTDNVMKRIERHVRIERERRGR